MFSIYSVHVFDTILCRFKRITIYVNKFSIRLNISIGTPWWRYNAVTMSGFINGSFTSIEIDSNSQARSDLLMNGISLCTYSATPPPSVLYSYLF